MTNYPANVHRRTWTLGQIASYAKTSVRDVKRALRRGDLLDMLPATVVLWAQSEQLKLEEKATRLVSRRRRHGESPVFKRRSRLHGKFRR